jgi:hypothetical protein
VIKTALAKLFVCYRTGTLFLFNPRNHMSLIKDNVFVFRIVYDDADDYDQFCTCQTIHFLVKVFTFVSLFQPPQKRFLLFSTTPIYPKDILRNFFPKKLFIFFCFSIFFFQIFFRSVSILPLVFVFF